MEQFHSRIRCLYPYRFSEGTEHPRWALGLPSGIDRIWCYFLWTLTGDVQRLEMLEIPGNGN